MLNDTKLDFWIKYNYNVLLKGAHGVGKTSMIKDAFTRNNLKWAYFSAATMDPWVDFIGVPKEIKDSNGNSYLDLVRPKQFAEDEIEAIFFDEFNRAPKKVRNAVMELLQFKSINGKKFNNLKIIWAAINPDSKDDEDGDEYDVEKLDPAQMDRFQIIVDISDKPSKKYFTQKFDENGIAAVDWWNSLDKKVQKLISPRRLEYILDIFQNKGDIDDAVPNNVSTKQLLIQLNTGSYIEQLKSLLCNPEEDKIKSAFLNNNFYSGTLNFILKNDDYIKRCLKYFPDENFNQLFVSNAKLRKLVLNDEVLLNENESKIKTMLKAGGLPNKVKKEISTYVKKQSPIVGNTSISNYLNKYYFDNRKPNNFIMDTTYGRDSACRDFLSIVDPTDDATLARLFVVLCCAVGRSNGIPRGNYYSALLHFFNHYMMKDKNKLQNMFDTQVVTSRMYNKLITSVNKQTNLRNYIHSL